MRITTRYGATGEVTLDFPAGATVSSVIADNRVKVALGFGNNVQGIVDGQIQDPGNRLDDGDVLTVETKANAKA